MTDSCNAPPADAKATCDVERERVEIVHLGLMAVLILLLLLSLDPSWGPQVEPVSSLGYQFNQSSSSSFSEFREEEEESPPFYYLQSEEKSRQSRLEMKRRRRAPAIFAQQLIEFAFSDRLPAIHLNTQKKRTLFHPCVSSWKNKLCLLALGSPDNEPLPPPPLAPPSRIFYCVNI